MIITSQAELEERCSALHTAEFITVDTEFLREKTYFPKLCLIQISGPDKDAFAVDPLDNSLNLDPVFTLLENESILKVFHAARQDLEIFYNLRGAVPRPVFDTQIAAMVCSYGDSIGYETLVRNITGNSLDKSSQYTNWAHRPLSQKQINYALGDVTHLCDIYIHLSEKLEELGRTSWVLEEEEVLANPETYTNRPEDMWQKIKLRSPKPQTLSVLRELAAWRERKAQKRNLPRTWVMRDDTLADMASQSPDTLEQLKKIRNIPGDLERKDLGKKLLGVIKNGKEAPKESWPSLPQKRQLSTKAAATIDMLKLLLKIQASTHGVATKLIANAADLELIATQDTADVAALKGWRAKIFGKEALDLKAGRIALGLHEGAVTKFAISDDTALKE